MTELHVASFANRLIGVKCPHCGGAADGGTCVDDKEAARKPKPGDYSVCAYCGTLNTYTAALTLRKVDRTERRKIARDSRLAGLLKIVEDVVAARRRKVQ